MLAGVPPFEGDSPQRVLLQHLREAPDLGQVPVPARPLVEALLTKEPEARVERALPLLDGLDLPPPPSPRPLPMAPPPRRPDWPRWPVALAGGGFLAVLASVVVLAAAMNGGDDGGRKDKASGNVAVVVTATETSTAEPPSPFPSATTPSSPSSTTPPTPPPTIPPTSPPTAPSPPPPTTPPPPSPATTPVLVPAANFSAIVVGHSEVANKSTVRLLLNNKSSIALEFRSIVFEAWYSQDTKIDEYPTDCSLLGGRADGIFYGVAQVSPGSVVELSVEIDYGKENFNPKNVCVTDAKWDSGNIVVLFASISEGVRSSDSYFVKRLR